VSPVRARLSRALGAPLRTFRQLPIIRRVAFHVNRIRAGLDLHFFRTLVIALVLIVAASAFLVTVLEPKKRNLDGLVGSGYWAVTTVIGSGDSSYVTSPGGYVIGWLLAVFGVAIVAALTAAIVGFVIDFLLKEGQGMGASGYSDHIVVCGWNATARELVAELQGDEFSGRVVVLHESERSPAGSDVYFVRGDATSAADLERAGIPDAAAAIICPSDATNEADMRSILTVLAIETMAPQVRTVVEVNNPKHVEHMRRAHADEILVTSRLASRLLARTALYPGLASLVTDIVSGGDGSELYRVELPDEYADLDLEDLSSRLRRDHNATLLAVSRDGQTLVNPPSNFRLSRGDTAVVVAESLGELHPLEPADALDVAD
jgi:voltage-gated potassium channel